MSWTLIKAAALDTLLRWLAKHVWALAQDMVLLVAQRDDLTGEQKFALAKTMLLDKMKEMEIEMKGSGVNWVLESAVQYIKFKYNK
jgi:type IV secretory pathway VirD2 relaxase